MQCHLDINSPKSRSLHLMDVSVNAAALLRLVQLTHITKIVSTPGIESFHLLKFELLPRGRNYHGGD